jgi:hypothetical protein
LSFSLAEIAYGFSPLPLSGIYAVEPGTAPFLRLRERSLHVGKTRIGLDDLKDIVIELGKTYTGDSYDLLEKYDVVAMFGFTYLFYLYLLVIRMSLIG